MKYAGRLWFYPTVLLGFVLMLYFVNNNWKDFLSNYKEATSDCSIVGKVKDIKIKRGVGYVMLEDGNGYSFYEARNFSYKPSSFSDFVAKGDSLLKRNNSDTIIVRRQANNYVFVLNQYLNQ